MNTRAYITHLKGLFPDYSRVQLLDFVNDVRNIILGQKNTITRFYDTSTGKDPVLTTTSGVYEYTLDTAAVGADILFVGKVYSDTYPEGQYGKDPLREDKIATTKQATGGTMAKVLFNSDPGGNDYYVQCWKKPTAEILETDDMDIPERLLYKLVDIAILGLVEIREHRRRDTWNEFIEVRLPEFISETYESEDTIYNIQGQGY